MTVGPTTVLTVAEEVRWVEADGEVVACDDDTGAVCVLTGSSALVFAQLDGKTSLEQVSVLLSELHSADVEAVQRDVLSFAGDLLTARLVRGLGREQHPGG